MMNNVRAMPPTRLAVVIALVSALFGSGMPVFFDSLNPLDGKGVQSNHTIPEEYREWISRAGSLCEQVPAFLVAGLIAQESGFNADLTTVTGARGPLQFSSDGWRMVGAKVDENGEVVGPAGSGDPHHIPDAVMASGRYLCQLADEVDGWLAEEKVTGDPTELMLAAYSVGEDTIVSFKGLPPSTEVQNYLAAVKHQATLFKEFAGV